MRAAAGAVETSCRVQAVFGALCTEQGLPLTKIYITVVHIDETSERFDRGVQRV